MSDAVTRVSVEIEGTEISFETGKLAKQASGAVVVRSGDTMVLCTATAGNLRDVDFLPLTVDVEERMYAAGKIPGSFFKREGRAGEKATLTARLIDRPIRPLFPKGWRYETQLVALPISVDHEHPYDVLAMNGASAALMISQIPLPTPVGAVRIGKIDGNFVVNPNEEDLVDNTELDLIVAGTDEAILMVEAGANEVPEAEILDALDIAHQEIKKLCAAQRELAEKAGKPKLDVVVPGVDPVLYEEIKASHGAALDAATQVEDKLDRQDATKAVEEEILVRYSGDSEAETFAEYRAKAQLAFETLEKTIIRERIAVQKRRPDGRAADEIRPISIEVGVAERRRARDHARGDAARHARAGDRQALLPPLQLPAVLGRGGRVHAWAQAPRHRPRRARRAGARADDPQPGRIPLHDPGGLGHPRVKRVVVDGLRLRLDAVVDGRRSPDQGRRRRYRDGPDQGGR
jgi:polyribonucleotide nucleotidyltransferase